MKQQGNLNLVKPIFILFALPFPRSFFFPSPGAFSPLYLNQEVLLEVQEQI